MRSGGVSGLCIDFCATKEEMTPAPQYSKWLIIGGVLSDGGLAPFSFFMIGVASYMSGLISLVFTFCLGFTLHSCPSFPTGRHPARTVPWR